MAEQRIAFFTSRDGVKIAYATYGPSEGQPLVFELAWMSQESIWNYDEGRRFFAALGRGRRLVTYDRRGMGASDPHAIPLDLDDEVADLLSLVDHLDLGEIDVFSMFGTVAIPYASRHPDRIRRLLLWAPSPHHRAYPAAVHAMMRDAWNLFTRSAATVICPSGPAEAQRWCVEAIRGSAAPEYYVALTSRDHDYAVDCERIGAPTLVIGRRDIVEARIEDARKVAAHIPSARFVALDGDTQHPMFGHDDYMKTVDEFLGSDVSIIVAGQATPFRTVLFTDLVEHTEMMSRLGDERGREVLREHERITREVLKAHGGTEVKTMGDGFMRRSGR